MDFYEVSRRWVNENPQNQCGMVETALEGKISIPGMVTIALVEITMENQFWGLKFWVDHTPTNKKRRKW